MKQADINATLEKAAAACDAEAERWAGLSGTCNDWKRKVEYDSATATAKACAGLVRGLKTESPPHRADEAANG